ncbi:DnaJ domain-containing protein [Marinomonas sp. C2222]|uniref:DnaJ domain-containing protein n=1 Tax=Marinomonas sargassi TaxID=2984494 RepID=A0ABT2YWK1_9GAMM|nr:DNA-J related domain-containing protein [Marinomonas sargassi]MCV2403949.1 DnaJ domain-containing protein [Marinomonas sargassi]
MNNPLIGPILEILKQHPNGVSEFDILKELKGALPEFCSLADEPNLCLFRQHFFIMNALYQLHINLWQEESLHLSISSTHIELISSKQVNLSSSNDISISVDEKLAAYYLDWSEYEKTDSEEVSRLIDSFYKALHVNDHKESALKTLQLSSANPSQTDIKKQYRKLAQLHHPDRGGDQATFINLRQAYETLKMAL